MLVSGNEKTVENGDNERVGERAREREEERDRNGGVGGGGERERETF